MKRCEWINLYPRHWVIGISFYKSERSIQISTLCFIFRIRRKEPKHKPMKNYWSKELCELVNQPIAGKEQRNDKRRSNQYVKSKEGLR